MYKGNGKTFGQGNGKAKLGKGFGQTAGKGNGDTTVGKGNGHDGKGKAKLGKGFGQTAGKGNGDTTVGKGKGHDGKGKGHREGPKGHAWAGKGIGKYGAEDDVRDFWTRGSLIRFQKVFAWPAFKNDRNGDHGTDVYFSKSWSDQGQLFDWWWSPMPIRFWWMTRRSRWVFRGTYRLDWETNEWTPHSLVGGTPRPERCWADEE